MPTRRIPSHDEYRQLQLQRLVATAKAVRDGALGIILGCREIAQLARVLDFQSEPAVEPFIAVDSETDHLPVGPERTHWSAEALKEKDAEIAEYEIESREQMSTAADNLVRWLESTNGIL
jgi:hypothetical protein